METLIKLSGFVLFIFTLSVISCAALLQIINIITMKKAKQPVKKSENVLTPETQYNGFPLVVCAESAQTAILLLSSSENNVALDTVRSLSKYAAVSQENLSLLYDLNIFAALLKTTTHSDICVKRYTYKLLAQMMTIPDALTHFVQDPAEIENLVTTLQKYKDDTFIQEFVGFIISNISASLDGCEALMNTDILNIAFEHLQSSDPDVRKNFLQVLYNILCDPRGENLVSESPQFDWRSILQLITDKYLDIQSLSLATIDKLLSRKKDSTLQKSFKDSRGLDYLFDVLETYALKNLHSKVLDILQNYNETVDCINYFCESGGLLRMMKNFEVAETADKSSWLLVVLKMALVKEGREMLHKCDMEGIICDVIAGDEKILWGDAYQAAALMCRHCSSASTMIDKNIVENTIGKLKADYITVKENALILLSELFQRDKNSIDRFIELNGDTVLNDLLLKTDLSQYGLQALLGCCLSMEKYEVSRKKLLSGHFIQSMIDIMMNSNVKTCVLSCDVIFGLMIESEAKNEFLSREGVSVIKKLLSSKNKELQNAACRLIYISSDDEITAEKYINEGVLHLLLEQSKISDSSAMREKAIKSILSNNLPAKFAYTRILNFCEITKQCFYAMKRTPKIFPDLQAIVENEKNDKYPVYMCNFSRDINITTQSNSILADVSNVSQENSIMDMLSTKASSSKILQGILQDDGLTEYLKELKKMFSRNIEITPDEKVQRLAKFVCDQMSGPLPGINCNKHFIQMHQDELMVDIGSNILPIETVKAGGALERCVLFKVLADKLKIPAQICRPDSGKSWIEVALETDKEYVSEFDCWQLPWRLLRSSHIVDLHLRPGKLLIAGSLDEKMYHHEV